MNRFLLLGALLLSAACSSDETACEDTLTCSCDAGSDGRATTACESIPQTECAYATCKDEAADNVCAQAFEPAGTACSAGSCDGAGECVPSGSGGAGGAGGSGSGAAAEDCRPSSDVRLVSRSGRGKLVGARYELLMLRGRNETTLFYCAVDLLTDQRVSLHRMTTAARR